MFESNAQTSGKVQENISGISAVKEMKMEQQRASEISKQLKTVADRSVQRGKMMNLASEGILGIAAFVQYQHYGTTRYCGTITNRRIIKTQNGGGSIR